MEYKLYIFEGRDEIIIGDNKEKILREYFDTGSRDIDDYEVCGLVDGTAVISTNINLRIYHK